MNGQQTEIYSHREALHRAAYHAVCLLERDAPRFFAGRSGPPIEATVGDLLIELKNEQVFSEPRVLINHSFFPTAVLPEEPDAQAIRKYSAILMFVEAVEWLFRRSPQQDDYIDDRTRRFIDEHDLEAKTHGSTRGVGHASSSRPTRG